jgi:outer membrane protein assembly factor BamB
MVNALAVAVALSFARGRAVRSAGVLVAGGVAVVAVGWLLADLGSGTPGSGTAVLVVGAVAAVVATALVAWDRVAVRPVVAAVLAVLVAGGAVAAATGVRGARTESVRADPVTPAAVTGRPSGGTWEWRSPSAALDVVAAGAGVVVASTEGAVTALDGPTGAVRWTHVRRGAHVRALVAAPGGGLVLAAFAPGGPRDTGAELLVVLDAMTGSVVHERVIDSVLSDVDGLVPTADVLPLRDRRGDDDFGTTATDLRTGRHLWTWSAPPGCRSGYALPASGRDVVLAPFECPDRLGVVALDHRTGQPRWEHTVRLDPAVTTDEAPRVSLAASPDGEVVSLRLSSAKALDTTGSDVLLRADTGVLLTSVDGGLFPRLGTGPVPVLELQEGARPTRGEAVDPRTGARTALDLAACPNRTADATTASTYLRVCGAELVWQELAGGPASSAPIAGREAAPPGGRSTAVVPAPGAVVIVRRAESTVVGFPTS